MDMVTIFHKPPREHYLFYLFLNKKISSCGDIRFPMHGCATHVSIFFSSVFSLEMNGVKCTAASFLQRSYFSFSLLKI
jgi:hypothetical protein